MKFSLRANQISPFIAMEFAQKAQILEANGINIIKLGLGEPDFGPTPQFVEALKNALQQPAMPYTNALGLWELREKIASFYKDMHNIEISPARIIITSGASAALLLVTAALVDNGDEVLIGDPSYPCNRQFMLGFGANVKLVPTNVQSKFQVDLQSIQKYWGENTQGLLIATPSNPTGTAIDYDELCAICDFAKSKNAWRIIDEIYLNLSDKDINGNVAKSILAHDDGAIIINSFSKYFGMTGYRLGWCVVPEEMVPIVEKLSQNYYICAPTPAQIAAIACFSPQSIEICEQRRVELKKRRDFVLKRLAQIGINVPCPPDGAFYVYMDISNTNMSAMEFCQNALEIANVSLTPGEDFGHNDAHKYVRLSYASSMNDLRDGLLRIENWLKSKK
jgi:aspartate/methionine/tyrosine aminotransferase